MKSDYEIHAYNQYRDDLLNRDNFAEFVQFMNASGQKPSHPEVYLITYHKVRTASKNIRMELRSISKKWLLDKGYQPHDDGDVPIIK